MAGQNVNMGTLNRLRTQLIIPSFPELNVMAWNLGKAGMTFTPQGQSTLMLPTMTGQATSPEPYMPFMLHVPLLKTQSLCELFIAKIESLATIGDCTLYVDSSAIHARNLQNCAIETMESITANGQVIEVGFTINGTWAINSSLYTL